MRLARIQTSQGVRQALIDTEGSRARPPGDARLPGVVDPPLSDPIPLDELRLLAPLQPGKIVAIGRNYAAHAAELGNAVPSRPMMFLKAPSSVIGPDEPVLLPPDSLRVEHEVELGVVIGQRCRHVLPERWADVVAGYVVLVDVTARDLQRRDKQFARGKGFDTFCPMGPWMQTGLDPADLGLSLRIARPDGGEELRQDGRTSAMIFDVPTLVAVASRVMTLHPGDVIATGTPEGVGPLVDGDTMIATIEGLGTLRNPVRRDPDVPELAPPIAQAR